MITFDFTVNLGNILTVIVIGGGALKVYSNVLKVCSDFDKKIEIRHTENKWWQEQLVSSVSRIERKVPELSMGMKECREGMIKLAGSVDSHVAQDKIVHEDIERRIDRLEE